MTLARRRLDPAARRGAQNDEERALFREEALLRRLEVAQPQPLAIAPPSWRLISLILLVVFVIACGFLFMGNFARKETVTGLLRPQAGEVVLGAERPGTLQSLFVQENQAVSAGDPLYDVRTETTLLDGRTVAAESQAVLEVQSEIAAAETEAQSAELAAQLAAVRQSESGSRALIDNLRRRRELAGERRHIAAEETGRARTLFERSYVTRQELRRKEDAELAAALEDERIGAELARAADSLAGFGAEARRLRARSAVEAARLRMTATQLAERRLATAQSRGFRVRAPIRGRVTALRGAAGMWVQPGEPLLTIVPEHGPLVAELYVPSRAVGFIAAGQAVRLHYDAYPFQKFGAAGGRVLSVSRSPLRPGEPSPGGSAEEAQYVVRVALDRQTIDAFGEQRQLRPGMRLRADLVLESRSFLEWLFEPVLSSSGRIG